PAQSGAEDGDRRRLGWSGHHMTPMVRSVSTTWECDESHSDGAGFGLQASGFRLRASGFGLQASGFGLRASGLAGVSGSGLGALVLTLVHGFGRLREADENQA